MQNREVVYLKKEPKYFFLRIFNEQEDYETQIMKECEAFYNQFSCYPNAIVMNPETFDRWFSCVENSVDETEEEDFGNLSLDELKQKLTEYPSQDIFVIGGAMVYKTMLMYCDTIYVTKVDACGNAQVFFPNLDEMNEWSIVEQSQPILDGETQITFCTYKNSNPKPIE